MPFRQSKTSLAALLAAAGLLLQPLPAYASALAPAHELVVAPDADYLAAEMRSAHDVFAAVATAKLVRTRLDEARIVRPTARTFAPFAVIDPATGKTVPRSASIVLTLGKHKGETVNAGTYWDQVNALESAASKAGATLRDVKPHVTGALRFNLASLKGGPGASAKATILSKSEIASNVGELKLLATKPSVVGTYPRGLAPSGLTPYTPAGTGALAAQKTAISLAAFGPKPCLNQPTFNVKSIALKADMDSLAMSTAATMATASPAPPLQQQTYARINPGVAALHPFATPTPTAAPGRMAVGTYRGASPQQVTLIHPTPSPTPGAQVIQMRTVLSLPTLYAHELALEQQKCPNPLSPMPTAYIEADLASYFTGDQAAKLGTGQIGDPSVAAVQFDGDVVVGPGQKTSRKPAPTLTASVDAKAYLFSSEADFLNATASAGGESAGNVDLMILGQSAETKSLATGTAAGGTSNTYTILNVNASIPIIAGIDVDLAANVTGTLGLNYSLDLGTAPAVTDQISLEETGKLDGSFNASLDVDALIVDVSGGVRGSLQFAAFDIPANGAVNLIMIDRTIGGSNDHNPRHIRDCQLSLSYLSSVGGATIAALSGNIVAYARECIEYVVGSSCSEQDVTVANFNGSTVTPSAGTAWKTETVGPRYTDGPAYGLPLTGNERYSPDNATSAIPDACNRFPIQYSH